MKVLLALTSGGGLLFLLLFLHAEELDILQPAEIRRRREEDLRFRDALRRLEISFFLHSLRRESRPERPKRTAIDDVTLRAILVEHFAKLVEHGSHVGVAYGAIFRHPLAEFVERNALFLANRACHEHFLALQRADTHFSFVQRIIHDTKNLIVKKHRDRVICTLHRTFLSQCMPQR